MSHVRTNPFSAPASSADRIERVGSALALLALLASWTVGYVARVPPDLAAHRAHTAQVRL